MQECKSLGLKEARVIVEAAIEKAQNTEGRPMCVAVTDRHGAPVYLVRMDGAAPVTARMCLTKCYTALEVLRDTGQQREVLAQMNLKPDEFSSTIYTTIPGGDLIKTKDGTVVGAVGTSGRDPLGPGGDEDIARAGVLAFEQSDAFQGK